MDFSPFVLAGIGALAGLITGVVGAYIALRTLKPNLKVLNSQEKSNLADAAESTAGALLDVVSSFKQERIEQEERNKQERAEMEERFQQERNALEERIQQLEQYRDSRAKQIEDNAVQRSEMEEHIRNLEIQIENLNREYLVEISKLRAEKDTLETHVAELEAKYSNSKEVIEELLSLLNEKGVVELPPKLLSLLGDSIKGWKWPPGRKPT